MLKNPSSRLSWWIKLAVGLVLAVLAGGGILVLLGVSATAKWERYADELRADGDPLDFNEIERARAFVPDEDNSALFMLGLAPFLPDAAAWDVDPRVFVFGDKGAGHSFFEGIDRSRVEPSEKFLDEYSELLEDLYLLYDAPTGRYSFLPNDWFDIEFNEYRATSKLLYLLSYLELADEEPEDAADTAVLLMRLAAALDDVPNTLGYLTRIAIDDCALRVLFNALRVGELSADDLLWLQDELAGREDTLTMRWALLGERAAFVGVCEFLAQTTGGPAETARRAVVTAVGASTLKPLPVRKLRRNQMFGADLLTRLLDAPGQSPELYNVAVAIEKERDAASDAFWLVKTLLPSMSRTCYLHLRIRAELRCAIAAIAAERYRLDHGRFPASLDALVPEFIDEVPIDPFSNEPIRLTPTDDGIVIFSVGQDPKDGEGLVATIEDPDNDANFGWRLVNPQHRGLLLIDAPPDEED